MLKLADRIGVAGGRAQGPDQLRARLGERAKEDDVGEVDVLEALGVLADPGDEALEVGRPLPSLLVQVLVADVDRDGRVQACPYPTSASA